jgi:hypothetical protein
MGFVAGEMIWQCRCLGRAVSDESGFARTREEAPIAFELAWSALDLPEPSSLGVFRPGYAGRAHSRSRRAALSGLVVHNRRHPRRSVDLWSRAPVVRCPRRAAGGGVHGRLRNRARARQARSAGRSVLPFRSCQRVLRHGHRHATRRRDAAVVHHFRNRQSRWGHTFAPRSFRIMLVPSVCG